MHNHRNVIYTVNFKSHSLDSATQLKQRTYKVQILLFIGDITNSACPTVIRRTYLLPENMPQLSGPLSRRLDGLHETLAHAAIFERLDSRSGSPVGRRDLT
jgi:hypothetical protein